MPDPFVLVLVFAATASLGWVAISTVSAAVLEGAEKAAQENGTGNPAASPYGRGVSPVRLATLSIRCGFGAFVAAFAAAAAAGAGPLKGACIAAAAAAAAAHAPGRWFRRKERKRRELAESQILELAVGLESGLRSGQALPAALEAVSGRLPQPIAEEIQTVLREYRLGLDLPDALDRMGKRVPCEDLSLLVGSIRLTQQAGGSLAEVLQKMVEMIRGRVEFQQKLKTMTSQGRFEAVAMSLAPLAVFVLLFLIDRPLMLPLVTTSAGWTAVAFDFVWVSIGFFIIKRITTIEV
ncbi:MAG: type II secretion system F family protein [Kiritimatiellae bacterium]|nr:type II secretion system F family protein [Kiritimatiellia bacterium]